MDLAPTMVDLPGPSREEEQQLAVEGGEPNQEEPEAGTDERQRRRDDALRSVYKAFDTDGNGHVGHDEMFELGKARRHLGHKDGEWTEEMNAKMTAEMGGDPTSGRVPMDGFVSYFHGKLPEDEDEFDAAIGEFMHVAEHLQEEHLSNAEKYAANHV